MALQITLSQTGKPVTPAGQARENLALATPIVATASGGNGTFAWLLADKPPADDMQTQSSSSLSSSSGTSVSWTPDNEGTYRIECTSGSETVSITAHAGATLATTSGDLPQREPAFGETTEHNVPDVLDTGGNRNGWERAVRRWMKVIKKTRGMLANYLPLAGGTMTGPIAMGAQAIANLADALQLTDAVNLRTARSEINSAITTFSSTVTTEITNAVANYLPLVGGTMSGPIAMGGSKITGGGAATAAGDFVIFSQLSAVSVSTLPLMANLAAIQALTMSTGANFIVDAIRGLPWAKFPAGTFSLDGNDTVVQTTDNSAQYVVAGPSVYAKKWRAQAAWYVDGSSGSNWNDGSSGHAVLNTDEIQRRCGGPGFVLGGPTDINFVTAPSNAAVSLTFGRSNVDHNLQLVDASTRTTLASGTLATYTTPSTANDEVTVISVTGISDWTTLVGKRVNFGANGMARVCAVNPSGLGVGFARITIPQKAPADRYSFASNGTPTVGQSVTVESLGVDVQLLAINFLGDGWMNGASIRTACNIKGLVASKAADISGALHNSLPVFAWDSDLRDFGGPDGMGFMMGGTASSIRGRIRCAMIGTLISTLNSGAVNQIIHSQPANTILTNVVAEGVTLLFYHSGMIVTNLAIFDSPGMGMQVHNLGTVFLGSGGWLLGKNNATFGVVVSGNGTIVKNGNTVKLTGATSDWQGNGANYTWANTPSRKFDRGILSGTLGSVTPGQISLTAENLPADAVYMPSYKVYRGQPGNLSFTAATAAGVTTVTVTSSSGSDDTSDIQVLWFSPSAGIGGIV